MIACLHDASHVYISIHFTCLAISINISLVFAFAASLAKLRRTITTDIRIICTWNLMPVNSHAIIYWTIVCWSTVMPCPQRIWHRWRAPRALCVILRAAIVISCHPRQLPPCRAVCGARPCRRRDANRQWPHGNATGCRSGPTPLSIFRPSRSRAANAETSSANRARSVPWMGGMPMSVTIPSTRTPLSYTTALWAPSTGFAPTVHRWRISGQMPFASWQRRVCQSHCRPIWCPSSESSAGHS